MTLGELRAKMKGIFVVLITPFKENEDLEDTVEILKKAAAIFSQSQRKNTR